MYKLVIIIIAAFILTTLPASAQPKSMPKEDKLQHLIEKLSLSQDQIASIKNIYNTSDEKIKAVNEKISEQHKELMNEIKDIIDKEDDQILGLLDQKQKEEFLEMKKERDRRPPVKMDQESRGLKPEGMKQLEK